MMGNVTLVKDSTTLQVCGSFIFKSNKNQFPECPAWVYCLVLILKYAASVSKLAADWKRCLWSGESDRPARLFGL